MSSAANSDHYQSSAWQHSAWGGTNQSAPYAVPPYWAGPPFWYPHGMSRGLGIAFMVLGFIFWWPVGLALLVYMIASGRIGCRRRRAWMQQNQSGASPDGPPQFCAPWTQWKSQFPSWGGGDRQPPSSGNHAFDDYRAETLRRLEDEQKDFTAFLERLRFAKDKTEFDQFMAQRRQAPPSVPPEEPSHG